MPELPKRYDPKTVETKWYRQWIDHRDFEANPDSSKPAFSIVMPPPNITGVLTLGHVLNNTIQDILARRARMQGFEVLWLPGTDHAGIATQTAVEKWLRKKEGTTRHDLGRREFLRRVREWQDKHGGIIIEQLKRLGCSCDWSRQRYTLDDAYVAAVQDVFVDLYNKGLIYRGHRMINWDPAAQTALSDEEVINKPQKGNLYFVRYEIVEEPGRFLEVATTRPETIMADTAMAFHPADKRYVDLLGKHAWRPLAREKIPIIADEAIDPEFGTGVLKVTPAHDTLDFEIGQRHNLPIVDVLHPDGRINCRGVPELHELDRFEARKKSVKLLKQNGLLSREEAYEHNVGFSDRSDVPIEPRISEQWFLRYPKTEQALAVVRDHLIRFFPAHWEKVYAQWLETIRDWCISRQVWWGHRIPAWYRKSQSPSSKPPMGGDNYVGLEPPRDPENWIQDPDTLDTWFSSWLWAYETMDIDTREKFYPTSVLVTAPDIIFFWVARMIIAGLEFKPGKSDRVEQNIPFHDVYFTGLIRDKQGRKMSKSLGNSPDPLELIDKYGADAIRIGVIGNTPVGQDILFDEKNVELGRNLCTKLWNAARFRRMHGPKREREINPTALTSHDKWILHALDLAIKDISDSLNEYELAGASIQLQGFFWGDFCDWYLEAAKTQLTSSDLECKRNTLAVIDFILERMLRLFHPLMPFITEELWHELGFVSDFNPDRGGLTIMFAPWPEVFTIEEKQRLGITREVVQGVTALYNLVKQLRNLRTEHKIPSNKKSRVVYYHRNRGISDEDWAIVRQLAGIEEVKFVQEYQPSAGEPVVYPPFGGKLFVSLTIDVAAERDRLDKQIRKVEAELRTVEGKLESKSFVDRAPAAVVEEHRERLKGLSAQLAKLKQAREGLN
jgi:valyl-tRNA synthetase